MQDRKDEDLVYMFAYVNGFLEDATVDNAVIDVNGFGINVRISADTASRLPGIGEEVRLYTYTYVKEDAFLLYGFSPEVIWKCSSCALQSAESVQRERWQYYRSWMQMLCGLPLCPGMPKAISRAREWEPRTAQRLILELKDKLSIDDTLISREIAAGGGEGILTAGSLHIDSEKKKEAVEALVALGYGQAESLKAVNALEDVETMDSGAISESCPEKIVLRNRITLCPEE